MEKVKYKDTYIYIDNSEFDINKTGIVIKEDDHELEQTKELILENNNLDNTSTDIWSKNDEQ